MTVDERVERLGLWSVFHKHLIVELFTSLRRELGDDYWVDTEAEVLSVPRPPAATRAATPDVDIVETKDSSGFAEETSPTSREAPGSSSITPALLEVDEAISEFERNWIEIRRRDWPDADDPLRARIVAVVEILSPSNKGLFGQRDLQKFLAKRRDYLLSTVSYTEIDILQRGQRELPPAIAQLAEHPMITWSSQVREQSRRYWAWGWQTRESLPTVILPLDYPRQHSVDLGDCYERAYHDNHWSSRLERD